MTNGFSEVRSAAPDRDIQEVAVYLSRITDLPFREATHWKGLVATLSGADARCPDGRDRRIDPDLHALLFPHDAAPRPVRVYFGNEFCELRIPNRREFEASCAAVHEAGLPLTFVTPPVTDEGLGFLVDRLRHLQSSSPGSEVVVNDWGVLRLVRAEFRSLTPVLGRLMSKLLRDPRVTPRCGDPGMSPGALNSLRTCSLDIASYRSVLASCGVDRVELDNVYQGIDLDFRAMGLRPSIYVPHGYVTTGRICLPANAHLPRHRKFGTAAEACPLPCLRVEIGLTDRRALADGGVHQYVQRGNTVFYRQSEPLVSQGVTWAARQGARLVFQPEIPF